LPDGVVPGPLAANGRELLVYDYAARRVLRIGGVAAGGTPVEGRVTGLAASPAGGFFAAFGEEATVARSDAAGRQEAVWEVPADGPRPAWPAGLAVEPGGDLFVADRHGGRIVVLDAGGKLAGIGAREGWDPGLLLYPSGVGLLGDGGVVVADQGNGRVQVFRRTGGGG
jgi:hypothetical protein